MAAAPAKAISPNRRAKNGQKAQGGRLSREPTAILAPPQAPLDFALNIMRDESKPDSLRATMARAAMPYLHKRGEAQERAEDEATQEEPISDFELARRIAHILGLGEAEDIRELESARTSAKIAEEQARAAEARARELERALAAQAMIAGREPEKKTRPRSEDREVAPGPVANIAPHAPAPGFVRFPSHSPEPVLPREEQDRCSVDPFDPHPGYRWIR